MRLGPRPAIPAAHRGGRQLDEHPLRAGEEHAAAVPGLHRAALRHVRDALGAGELPARARVALQDEERENPPRRKPVALRPI